MLIVFDLHGDQCRSGFCCRPGEQILGLPVGDWGIVDQEAVGYGIIFRIAGRCCPIDPASQDLGAL